MNQVGPGHKHPLIVESHRYNWPATPNPAQPCLSSFYHPPAAASERVIVDVDVARVYWGYYIANRERAHSTKSIPKKTRRLKNTEKKKARERRGPEQRTNTKQSKK